MEIPLRGGFVNEVVRAGDTVRRPPRPGAAFTHRLLARFAENGWAGAPRYLGVDGEGREVLTYVPGEVPWDPARRPPYVGGAEGLAAVARLVRGFHDLTAGTDLAGAAEVVCHNDLSPRNTVYRDGLPVAFIDWDIAAPGERIHDLAHVCWQFVGLGPGADPSAAAAGMRVVADAYRLADRSRLVDTVLWWQDRCWRGILAAAAAGEPAMIRLRDAGAADAVRAEHDWTSRHAAVLASGILDM